MHPDTLACNRKQEPGDRAIRDLLATGIDRILPEAENRV